MRASLAAEKAGVRTVSVVTSSFVPMARAIARMLGVDQLPVAEFPGVPMTQSEAEFREITESTLVPRLVDALASPPRAAVRAASRSPEAVAITGTLDEIQQAFLERGWSDGLPIIPPTPERVERFLAHTDRARDDRLGILLPGNGAATVLSVAVNGVAAGCRPEYMPVLLAVAEILCDPEFRIQDAGSTPGWEPLVIVNGPLIDELQFNAVAGVMRPGRQANTSVGRFVRLYMRNVAGLRIPPGDTDKATLGFGMPVALAENERALAELGWPTLAVERGFLAEDSVVTMQSIVGVSPATYSAGDDAPEHLATLIDVIGQGWAYWSFSGFNTGHYHPLLVLSPSIAAVMARSGLTKDDVRRAFGQRVLIPERDLERYARAAGVTDFSNAKHEELLRTLRVGDGSSVRALARPEQIGIVVAGDPGRNQSRGFVQNHRQGQPISRRVILPRAWASLREREGVLS